MEFPPSQSIAFGKSFIEWRATGRKKTKNQPVWAWRSSKKLSSNTAGRFQSNPKSDAAQSSASHCRVCDFTVKPLSPPTSSTRWICASLRGLHESSQMCRLRTVQSREKPRVRALLHFTSRFRRLRAPVHGAQSRCLAKNSDGYMYGNNRADYARGGRRSRLQINFAGTDSWQDDRTSVEGCTP